MSGKPEMNEEKVIELLKPVELGGKGLLPKQIIDNHHDEINLNPKRTRPFTKANISIIKNKAIKDGRLPESMTYVPPPKKEKRNGSRRRKRQDLTRDMVDTILNNITPDQVLGALAVAISNHKELKQILPEFEKYKKGYQNMREHAAGLENKLREKTSGEQQFRLAQQQKVIGKEE